ncbi:MAG: CinA-like protein [Candidatus Hydrogenedentota bacterium]
MNAEIVMIGTELLLGQIVDTNAAHIGRTLGENGISLYQKTTVGDNRQRIVRVLESALERADVIITSGGLGPTEDDLTREAVADVFGRKLEYRQELFDELVARFASVKRPITENNKKQATALEGAEIIPNPNGTAPGIICGDSRGEVICLPGVPLELYAMLEESVLPYLRRRYGLKAGLYHRVLKVCGVGESWVDSRMGDLMASLENPTIGVLASPEWVRIRITARAESEEEARELLEPVEQAVRERLPGLVMGTGDDTLEGVVDGLLQQRGWTLAVAETFTGGMIAQRLTAAGARAFAGSTVFACSGATGRGMDERARDQAEAVRVQFHATCGLGIAADPESRALAGEFVTPDGRHTWTSHYRDLDPLNQLRAATIFMERVRRVLADVDTEHQDAKV